MLIDERTFLINPFNLKSYTDEAISEQINELAKRYKFNADLPMEIAYNIEIYANILYLYGEMIARLGERHAVLEYSNDKGEMLETHNQRKKWAKENTTDKCPNIDFFKALAYEKYELDRQKEFSINADLIRFKKAYESIESKMNALKKKLEATKYELGVN